MTRASKILSGAAALFLALHIANGIYFGGLLPNCARSYDEGMNSHTLQFRRLVSARPAYLPGYEIISGLIARSIGKNWTAIYLANNTFHLALLLIFSCLFGVLVRDFETGALAALLLCLYPLAAGSYNRYCMDFALMGIVMAAVYFIFKSDFFARPGYTLLFFAIVAYGVLIKETILAFIAGPFFYALFLRLKDLWRRSPPAAFRFMAGLAAVVTILGVLASLTVLRILLWDHLFWEAAGIPWYAPENLSFFWKGLWETQLTPLFTAVLAAGVYYFAKEADARLKILISLWILLPNVILLFIPHGKTARYLLPQLPALAIVSSFALRKLLDSPAGRGALTLIFAGGLFQLYVFFYAPETLSALSYKGFNYWKPEAYRLGESFDAENFRFKTELPVKIGRAITTDMQTRYAKDGKYTCSVTFFPDDWTLESYILRSYLLLNSDLEMTETYKGVIIMAPAYSGNKLFNRYFRNLSPADIDYAVQLAPRGAPRPPLKENLPGWLRASYETACWSLGLKPEPQDWEKVRRVFAERLSTFRDVGRVSGGNYDAYISAAPR
ncbi:MAG: hypothetical protein A2X28_03980 [Elusimicrobia bacterium GWA2_56_46]|nr:MAG: hypothetical protein A2X28_03980 [Elusimicrobia bacterium GWA2_56_46]OGR55032.1 MAG: hypothetical protein A2X39_02915 [Elusimicrobia bacterium GWC2_56_31]HBW23953.1 hypothetical protein [Elusimicrobiota bacterium]